MSLLKKFKQYGLDVTEKVGCGGLNLGGFPVWEALETVGSILHVITCLPVFFFLGLSRYVFALAF